MTYDASGDARNRTAQAISAGSPKRPTGTDLACAARTSPVRSASSSVSTKPGDPQFTDRFPLYPHETHGADMLPFPVKFVGEKLPEPSRAPTVGEQSERVLRDVLGYDDARIAALRRAGALG